jgi:hypothetical protein
MDTVEKVVDKTVKVLGFGRDLAGAVSLYCLVHLALKLNKERKVIDYVLDRMDR